MTNTKLYSLLILLVFAWGCGSAPTASDPKGNTNGTGPAKQTITIAERPQTIKDQMATRGEQDAAKPTLKIIEPQTGAMVAGSTVKVKLDLGGDLNGYMPMMNPDTKMGNHIHVILDNQPYEAYYNLGQEFELRNVTDGEHVLRVFPSRPWHESYKDEGAFQMVRFTVTKGGADASKPATTKSGQPMSNANANTSANTNSTSNATPSGEGKAMMASSAGTVDPAKPLLTYSRPKGEYKDADADAIMIDFWLTNAKLTGDGGEYKVRYSVDGGEAKLIEKWAPIWLSGWVAGKHNVKLELVDKDGKVIDNGGYNSTTREITVVK